jgi:putative spermidine/putrescine transport system permease protein
VNRRPGGGWALRIAVGLGVAFMLVPLVLVVVYAFNDQSATQSFPPPGLTTRWFGVARRNGEISDALKLSFQVGLIATALALVLGSLAAAAVYKAKFFGRETISLIIVLPLALPGIVTGIALRSAFNLAGMPFTLLTIAIGHATFCVVIVYNNVVARLRRSSGSIVEASMDLGASGWQTFRYVVLPSVGTAIVAGGLLAFALSFDEIIVTTFTAGDQKTLPLWIYDSLNRPKARPVLNVVAILIMAMTLVPILIAQRMTRDEGGVAATR